MTTPTLIRSAILLTVLAFAVAAGNVQTVLQARLREDFASQVAVAGNGILVGLTLGEVSGHNADPEDMRVPLRALADADELCLTANTRDGRYWAELSLQPPEGTAALGKIQPNPPWRYLDQLRRYRRSDFAAVARIGNKCNINPDVQYLPVVYEGKASDVLTVSVNSQRAIETLVELVVPDHGRQTRRCSDVDSTLRAIAFDAICTFDISSYGGRQTGGTLVVHRVMRTGRRADEFRVILP